MDGGHGHCRLGNDLSLKHFCQFDDESRILSKKPSYRNHLANFGEVSGPISARDLAYATNDGNYAFATLGTIMTPAGLFPNSFCGTGRF